LPKRQHKELKGVMEWIVRYKSLKPDEEDAKPVIIIYKFDDLKRVTLKYWNCN